ncbi:MAG: tetratricopeptide repeat protein [Bacteroidota bacterium]
MIFWISNMAREQARRAIGFVALIAFVGLIGCGGSSETTQTGASTDTTAVRSDTTMIAHDTTAAKALPETTAVVQAPPTKEEMLQQQMEEIKTENIQLQQKLDASEQKNKELMAKISDLEAAQIAAQEKPSKPAGMKSMSMSKAPAGKSTTEDIEHYEGAVSLSKGGKFKEAIDKFQSLLDGGIKADYADNCHYWIGLNYYGMHEYKTAIQHFQEVLKFKISEKKDDSQFMIAQSYDRMGNHEQAQVEYKKFVELYPNSEYLQRAKARIK